MTLQKVIATVIEKRVMIWNLEEMVDCYRYFLL